MGRNPLVIGSMILSAERLRHGQSHVHSSLVGLLVKNKAVVRRYRTDVWTVQRGHALRPTRREWESYSCHTECLVRPQYAGIVVKSPSRRKISAQALQACMEIANRYNLPLLYLSKGGHLAEYKKLAPDSKRQQERAASKRP